jgi:hypothetical protein
MNGCIKTGVAFSVGGSPYVYAGDLFLVDGGWQIRGIPDGDRGGEADVVVGPFVFTNRFNSPYRDSPLGIELQWVSPVLRAEIEEWSPHAVPYLPRQVTA